MLSKLQQGTTLIVDRYSFSGAVFTAAKKAPGLDLEWCKASVHCLSLQADLQLSLDNLQCKHSGNQALSSSMLRSRLRSACMLCKASARAAACQPLSPLCHPKKKQESIVSCRFMIPYRHQRGACQHQTESCTSTWKSRQQLQEGVLELRDMRRKKCRTR